MYPPPTSHLYEIGFFLLYFFFFSPRMDGLSSFYIRDHWNGGESVFSESIIIITICFLLLFLLSIRSSQVLIVNGYITHQEFSLLVLLTSLSFSHSPFSPAIRCDWLVCVYDTAWRGMEGPGAGGSIWMDFWVWLRTILLARRNFFTLVEMVYNYPEISCSH